MYKKAASFFKECLKKRKERNFELKLIGELKDFFNGSGFLNDFIFDYIKKLDEAQYNMKHLKHYESSNKPKKLKLFREQILL
jgi:hypothetical protein